MRHMRHLPGLLLLPLIGLFGMAGCGSVLPTQLETRLASNGNAEDHMTAAVLYEREAEQLSTKATQFGKGASQIRPLEDTKGFRRRALEIAAQENWTKAKEMRELYAAHFEMAQTMYGKKSPE